MVRAFTRQVAARNHAQFIVDQGNQRVPRSFIPSAPIGKKPCDITGRFWGHLLLPVGGTNSESKKKVTLKGWQSQFACGKPMRAPPDVIPEVFRFWLAGIQSDFRFID
jgi:hypothetical protein